jgi:regulator of replication initiation timing
LDLLLVFALCFVQEETAAMIQEMSQQLAELLKANQELRAENEYLRRIY